MKHISALIFLQLENIYQIYYNGDLKMNTDVNVLQWLFKTLSSPKTVTSFKGKVCEIME